MNEIHDPASIDPTDAAILSVLADNARITNSDLSARVGIPASTCLYRVRALVKSGLIAGFYTHVSRRKLGLDLDVLVGVVLKDKQAQAVHQMMEKLKAVPQILTVMRTTGAYDLTIHAQVRDTEHLLHDVIDPLSDHVASTQTMLIVEHWRRPSLFGGFVRV